MVSGIKGPSLCEGEGEGEDEDEDELEGGKERNP